MSYEIALQRIETCDRTGATELDLSGLWLESIPDGIVRLKSLTKLNLSANSLTVLPDSISQLRNLTSLYLGSEISSRYNNRLTTLPESFRSLQHLRTLDLSGNRFTAFPAVLTHLQALTSLNLSSNRLTGISDDIGLLRSLTSLDLSSNQITALPDSIGWLPGLTFLNLSSNIITELPTSFSALFKLATLDLHENRLSDLPIHISHLKYLSSLNLTNNRFVHLPDAITKIASLIALHLDNNNLVSLPYGITQLYNLKTLDLRNNPNLPIPQELLQDPRNVQAVLDYLRATHRDRPVLLNEVKVLVVGEAEVGKTTLVQTLLGDKVNINDREPTLGIVVRDETLLVQGRKMLVHFWDFGGQEIMHNTHRLFLTTRSCYLLVLDATKNEEGNKVVEWLKTIHLYAPDAPIILVINKWDKYKLRLNLPALEQHHPIASVIETSCTTRDGIERLKATLQQELSILKHLNDEIPATWMEVRRQIGKENKDYLGYEEFARICSEHNIPPSVNSSVAELLHALGVLFTYSNDPTLKLTHILNPNWVTGGIYPILNDPDLLQGRGFVTDQDIARVLIPKGYSLNKHPFILSMMFVFELAYRLQHTRYLIPDLLPKSLAFFQWNEENSLRFVYQYDFVPPGLFSRFVIRMREEVNYERVWRTGVILHQFDRNYARVVVDTDAKRIEISIVLSEGDYHDRRTLLDALRDKFKKLHDDYAGLEVKELVPINNTNTFVDYADLIYWAKREEYKQSSRIAGDYDVRELLNGISARAPQYPPPQTTDALNPIERRKHLAAMIAREFSNPAALEDFLYFEGLEQFITQISFDTSQNASRAIIRTLERAGVDSNGRSILKILLEALAKQVSGHPNDVVFLQTWARELKN